MVDVKPKDAVTSASVATEQRAAPSVKDIRGLIPPLGLTEYWYPALEDKKVKCKPIGLKMLGEDLVFFRGKDGNVAALWNVCPHRGGSLMHGDCHFEGTVSCPYHGWTFDSDGNVLAVLPEGPESKIPGKVQARKYPTVTLKGMVFVWMGNEAPAPIEEDVPPEFFDSDSHILFFDEIWPAQWNVALENGGDAHVPYVHRDAARNFMVAMRPISGPYGGRQKMINGRAIVTGVLTGRTGGGSSSAGVTPVKQPTKKGNLWQRTYFPQLDAYWPKHRRRLLWMWLFKPGGWTTPPTVYSNENVPEEWQGGHHLPSMYRGNRGESFFTRACVAITEKTSRQIYYKAVKPRSWIGLVYEKIHWKLWAKWSQANFSSQDFVAVEPQRYDTQEMLSATDIHQVLWRRLVLQARGMMTLDEAAGMEETPAEEFSHDRQRELGQEPDLIVPTS
jgi:phenylpropionate dioxygenase-like ring-hydroxylating dioxygenase large terminal subunit